MSKLTFLFGLLVALSVFASGEAGHDDHQAIPGQMIILQVLNFLLFGIIALLTLQFISAESWSFNNKNNFLINLKELYILILI